MYLLEAQLLKRGCKLLATEELKGHLRATLDQTDTDLFHVSPASTISKLVHNGMTFSGLLEPTNKLDKQIIRIREAKEILFLNEVSHDSNCLCLSKNR